MESAQLTPEYLGLVLGSGDMNDEISETEIYKIDLVDEPENVCNHCRYAKDCIEPIELHCPLLFKK